MSESTAQIGSGAAAPALLPHAPVMVLPDIIDLGFTRELIAYWEAGDKFHGGVSTGTEGVAVDQTAKIREDVAITDPALTMRLRKAIAAKVIPAIRSCFQSTVTQHETLRIGCYDAAEGGFFQAHRDNSTPFTAYRKFALTLNLNTGEYDGGQLRFPEFATPPLMAPAGGGVIFSCNLLHEALPVTRGRRFGVFTFLFDDDGARYVQGLLARQGAGQPPRPGGAKPGPRPAGTVRIPR